jgi:glucose-6-phosphate-specific signal transduction histidine kinase
MYKLDGIDKDWIDARSNDAVYNYLPPGRYTFRAEGVNAENLASRHIRELSIHVQGPFWRSWWFLCLVLLAGAALLYVLDRQRMQRKAALEDMRSDISGNLHEEVNKALQNINVLSEIARIKAEKDPEQAINYINEIHHKSHNMIIAMDDMLWAIDPVNDNMAKAIARMREFAEALNHRHGVRIRLQAEKGVERLHPDMNIRHELLLIYKLVLRVLVEEANARDTVVQLEQDHGMLNLSVYSKGIRIDHRSGRSIRLMEEARSRASAIRGALDLHSDDKGTSILFTCPSTF